MFLVKTCAIAFLIYGAYEWYSGRRARVPIALTVSGAFFAFWISRMVMAWIRNFQDDHYLSLLPHIEFIFLLDF